MSKDSTLTANRDAQGMTAHNWARHAAKTDEEITAAALADPDAQPITAERLPPPALSKVIRNKLRVTRETFAASYGIPFDTLRAWERHEAEPTPAETAYLKLIEREPELAKIQAVPVAAK